MSREEAATIYLDTLLGFHPAFTIYREADNTLCEKDKGLLRNAVDKWPKGFSLRHEGF